MAFKLGSETRNFKPPENTHHIYRDKLDDGILGEAYDDGSIAVDESVKPGSEKEKEVVAHEMDHIKRMEDGQLAYGVNYVKWKDGFHQRKDGKIKYKGEWYNEGDENLPWEELAFNAGNEVKNS